MDEQRREKGLLSVREAGAKGGRETARLYGTEHYQRIGRQGGAKVRALIEAAKRAEAQEAGK